jgi:hypothetical protein
MGNMNQKMNTLVEKKKAYTDFFTDDSKEILIVVGMDCGGEGKTEILNSLISDTSVPHGELVVYYDGGSPVLYPASKDSAIFIKTIYQFYKSDSALIEAMSERYDSIVSVVFFNK